MHPSKLRKKLPNINTGDLVRSEPTKGKTKHTRSTPPAPIKTSRAHPALSRYPKHPGDSSACCCLHQHNPLSLGDHSDSIPLLNGCTIDDPFYGGLEELNDPFKTPPVSPSAPSPSGRLIIPSFGNKISEPDPRFSDDCYENSLETSRQTDSPGSARKRKTRNRTKLVQILGREAGFRYDTLQEQSSS